MYSFLMKRANILMDLSTDRQLLLCTEWTHIIVEKSVYTQCVTVQCMVSANGIWDPYFVRDHHEILLM